MIFHDFGVLIPSDSNLLDEGAVFGISKHGPYLHIPHLRLQKYQFEYIRMEMVVLTMRSNIKP